MNDSSKYIIIKPALYDTLRNLPIGESATFKCQEFCPYSSVKSAISYLNRDAGRTEFTISTDDNGASYTITRK